MYEEINNIKPLYLYIFFADIELSKWDYDDYDDWWRKYWSTTEEPDFWLKRTVEPYIERDINISSPYLATIVALIVGALAVLLVVIFCVVYCSNHLNQNRSPTANRLNMPQPTTSRVSSAGNTRTPINVSLASASNLSNSSHTTDKPPGYDVVVLSDLGVRLSNYPKVKPNTEETPPPKYEENFVLKY